MRKAIGFVIVLWAVSQFLPQSFIAFGSTLTQGFKTIETAARVAEIQLIAI